MEKYFTNKILLDIRNYAEEKAPNEACGFIVDDEFMPVDNKAGDPEANFKMSGEDYIYASSHGEIRCIVHSHNNCDWVSEADQIEQLKHNIPFGVVFLRNNNYYNIVFWGEQLPIQSLLNRPFIHGVYDCYGLVRDYYRQELGINLYNYPREMRWWEDKKNNLLEGNKTNQNFYEVNLKDIKQHDMVLFQIRGKNPNHSAVYLGRDLMLHHMYGKLSNREPIGRYRRFITGVFRHGGI